MAVSNKLRLKVQSFIQLLVVTNRLGDEQKSLFAGGVDQDDLLIINTSDRLFFLFLLLSLIYGQKNVVLFNPSWSLEEQELVKRLVLSGSADIGGGIFGAQSAVVSSIFLIPTGGTSGKVKFAIHDLAGLAASVAGFRAFFGLERVHCFCVLPLYHVSGLMQVMRSLLSEGQFYLGNYGELKRGVVPEGDFSDFCISLVPTQLQVLLDVCPEWLQRFRLILIGGAPAWRSLLEKARNYRLNVALTYGMTETASQVVALKPEDFLAGKDCVGQVLPHAQIHLDSEGLISIEAKSLFYGYYPDWRGDRPFVTDDIGYFDDEGYLHIVGRKSQKIISGGENIYPAEIEATIQATGLVEDVAVCGIPDEYWGEAVIAVVVLKSLATVEVIKAAIATKLSRYKLPKHWLNVAKLPRNAQGKLNRTVLREMIEKDYQS
ncbi:AMP-binding protein [[Limnothrix rosea] IAM M-220]|uniref:AMP-binding protein n=1 Tax=[Limnothrix rosea] IAM M-220 TaxID=454133 RepID=UPI0009608296|nr:AMP-binding protein [[Limnothrix rosea] IAM M-220]OKH11999.1 2-succinylbenzoate-CoA ligase [[Limnothrix rosea] IAM M-220]